MTSNGIPRISIPQAADRLSNDVHISTRECFEQALLLALAAHSGLTADVRQAASRNGLSLWKIPTRSHMR